MSTKIFHNLSATEIAEKISKAKNLVCYAAPGISLKSAQAIVDAGNRISRDKISVSLAFSEEMIRMGFGDKEGMQAVDHLKENGIILQQIQGMRLGILVFDNEGYVFAPQALAIEEECSGEHAFNASRLSEEQAMKALAGFSNETKKLRKMQRKEKSTSKRYRSRKRIFRRKN